MVSSGELSNLPETRLARTFGLKTRKPYYDIRDAVINGSAENLVPKRTGPEAAPKRTRKAEILIVQKRQETDLNMYEIAEALTKLGFNVSSRLVAEVLSDYGLSKKTADTGSPPAIGRNRDSR